MTDQVNKSQRVALLSLMADGQARTLAEIVRKLRNRGILASEAGVSARLRDLRHERFGGWLVDRELVPGASRLYRYRVLPPIPVQCELFSASASSLQQ